MGNGVNRIPKIIYPAIALLLWTLPLIADESAHPARVLDLEGAEIAPLSDLGPGLTVFLFTRTDCPISNRFAPEVKRLSPETEIIGRA